ncbi:MAG TPA: hypothetical protein VKU84_16985 [Stellaceae bacterium]|nr:hypothetical protein [Stellaceae bacterium]
MAAARFLRHFLAALALALASVGAFTYVIDPFELWDAPEFARINTIKSIGNVRFVKPLQAEVRRPETVILGSSRALYGLDPRDFPDPERTYNFGIHALTAKQMRGYGEHTLADTPVKRLVIELGFFEFNQRQDGAPDYDNAILGRAALLRAAPIVLFSQEALGRSGRTITDSRKGAKLFNRKDGFAYFRLDTTKDPVGEFLDVIHQFTTAGGPYDAPRRFAQPMAAYRALLLEAKAKRVEIVTFIAPEHASLLVALDRKGLWPLYLAWERRLVEVSAEMVVPLWDFSGYNAYTVTPLADGYRTHFDASHFRPEIGRLMLARMSGAAQPADFGVLLSPDVIERHLAELEAGRVAYRRDHPEDVARVEAVVDRASLVATQ